MSRSRRTILRRPGLGLAMLLAALMVAFAPPAMALVTVGELDTPDVAIDLEVVDGLAYIADYATATTNQGSSLRIVDVSDPEHPVELGSSSAPVAPRGLQVDGGLVFVADGATGLRILDASDPAAPGEVSLLALPGLAYGVELAGDLAYVSSGPLTGGTEGWLHVVDVSDPAQPVLVGSLTLPGEIARDADAAGSLLFVATTVFASGGGLGNLLTLDVQDPSQPTLVSSLPLPGRGVDLEVSDAVAYVAAADAGLVVVDVSNPGAPIALAGVDTWGTSRGVSVEGTRVYLTDLGLPNNSGNYATLRLIDATDPSAPIQLGVLVAPETRMPEFLDGAFQVQAAGGFAYVANGRAGLRVIELSHPEFPSQLSSLQLGSAQNVERSGGLVYVSHFGGVDIFDASHHLALEPVGQIGAYGWSVSDFSVEENRAYLLGAGSYPVENAGLRIADVTNPSAPTPLGSLDLPLGSLYDLEVIGDHVLIAHGQRGLLVVDASDPVAPAVVGELAVPALEIASDGQLAYLAAGPYGLLVVDVSDRSAPFVIGQFADGRVDTLAHDAARGIVVTGDTIEAPESVGRIIDVADPAHPAQIAAWSPPAGGVRDIDLENTLAYVGCFSGVVRVLDLTVPTQPREILAAEARGGSGLSLAVSGRIAWAVAYSAVAVVDLGPEVALYGDFDADGLRGREDNCSERANTEQLDTNRDGFGNACDADYDDDGIVGTSDFTTLRRAFLATEASPGWNPDLDANGDGAIGNLDFAAVRRAFLSAPGPSGLSCAAVVPCPAP